MIAVVDTGRVSGSGTDLVRVLLHEGCWMTLLQERRDYMWTIYHLLHSQESATACMFIHVSSFARAKIS